jgi:RNA polymerase sigma-70 factor, ECF subfamily
MSKELSDQELVEATLAGDHNSYSQLVRRYQSLVFSIILKKVANREAAEELAQDVFVRAFKSLRTFRFESELSTWLVRIAINLSYNYRKSSWHRKSRRTDELGGLVVSAGDAQPDSVLAARQMRLIFEDCFAKLSQKLSQALLLSGLQGLSYEQAAEVMQIPVGTVRSRLNQARLLVMECMQTRS